MATTGKLPYYESRTPQAQQSLSNAQARLATITEASKYKKETNRFLPDSSPFANYTDEMFASGIESATAGVASAQRAYQNSVRDDQRGAASDISVSAINAIRAQSGTDSFELLGAGEPNGVEDMFGMKQTFDNMMSEYTSQISGIEENEALSVDYGASIAKIKSGFEANKDQIMSSALLGIKKQAMEADAYFGSSQSDQRSSARFKMASSMKTSMMQAAFGQISSIYDNQIKAIVGLEVDEQKTNAELAVKKATLISDITGQASALYANVFGTVSQSYTERLKASVQFASDQVGHEESVLEYGLAKEQLQFSRESANLQSALTLLGSPGGAYRYKDLYPVAQL